MRKKSLDLATECILKENSVIFYVFVIFSNHSKKTNSNNELHLFTVTSVNAEAVFCRRPLLFFKNTSASHTTALGDTFFLMNNVILVLYIVKSSRG